MSKRHDDIVGGVLKDLQAQDGGAGPDRSGTRFLQRTNALAETGEREEKVLRWVDPARCTMWSDHNRAYELLTEDNCRDLIDSIRSQGQQEFPAIVRRLPKANSFEYEVICGARRHFAVSWLRANNYPQFRYLIEVRDLSDEAAFRLADIENRDREDISDFERARDYARALEQHYGGRQKGMAERLEVSEGWLSRYLALARLPAEVVAAYPSLREVKEAHARALKPLLMDPASAQRVLDEAREIATAQAAARVGQGATIASPLVLARLKAAASPRRKPAATKISRRVSGVIVVQRKAGKTILEFSDQLATEELRVALEAFLEQRSNAAK